ncbi:MAG: hypothetical protein ABEJ83_04660 [Candidatus Nanohaloarchaea archaeon]
MGEIQDCVQELLKTKTFDDEIAVAEALIDEHNLENLESFIEESSGFILTEKREEIFNEIIFEKFMPKNTPYSVLIGNWGSGKSALMNELVSLADEERKYQETPLKLEYGEYEVQPVHITMVEGYTIRNFLEEILKQLKEGKSSSWLISSYRGIRDDRLAVSTSDDLNNFKDIAGEMKEFSNGQITEVLVYLSKEYKKSSDGEILGFFIDEVEQAARFQEGEKLNDVVRFFLRQVTENSKNFSKNDPAAITVFSIASFEVLREYGNWRGDILDRLEREQMRLDMTPDEAKELMQEILNNYLTAITADFKSRTDDAENWYEKLEEAQTPEDENYTYPIKEEVHNYIVHRVLDREETSDTFVEDFRSYKYLMGLLFDVPEEVGSEPIGFVDLINNGKEIKYQLANYAGKRLEGMDKDAIPDEESINKTIQDTFTELDSTEKSLLAAVAIYALSRKNEDKAHLDKDELSDEVDFGEVENVDTEEVSSLIDSISEIPNEFFEAGDGRLIFNISEFLDSMKGDVAPEGEKKRYRELLNEKELSTVNKTLSEMNTLEALYHYYKDDYDVQLQDEKLIAEPKNVNLVGKFIISTNEATEDEIRDLIEKDNTLNIGLIISESQDKPYVNAEVILPNILSEYEDEYSSKAIGIFDKNDLKTLASDINHIKSCGDYEAKMTALRVAAFLRVDREGLKEYKDNPLPATPLDADVIDKIKPNNSMRDSWVSNRLKLRNTYDGQDIYDLIYAIQNKLEKNSESVLYETADFFDELDDEDKVPNIPYIDNNSSGKNTFEAKVTGSNENGDAQSSYWAQEYFIDEEGRITPTEDWNQIYELIEGISEKVEEEGSISYPEVEKIIFGTSNLGGSTKGLVYLILLMGEVNKEWHISNKGGKLRYVEIEEWGNVPQKKKRDLKKDIKNSIREVVAISVQKGEPSSELKNLAQLYSELNEIDENEDGALDELEAIDAQYQDIEIDLPESELLNIDIIRSDVIEDDYPNVGDHLRKIREISGSGSTLSKAITKRVSKLNDKLALEVSGLETTREFSEMQELINDLDSSYSLDSEQVEENEPELVLVLRECSEEFKGKSTEEIHSTFEEKVDTLEKKASAGESLNESIYDLRDYVDRVIPAEPHTTFSEEQVEEMHDLLSLCRENIDEIISEKIKEGEEAADKCRELAQTEVYKAHKKELQQIARKIESTVSQLKNDKRNPLESKVREHVRSLNRQKGEELNEIEEKAVEDSKEKVEKWKSSNGIGKEVSFEDIKNHTGDSLEDIADRISPSELYSLYDSADSEEAREAAISIMAKICMNDIVEEE